MPNSLNEKEINELISLTKNIRESIIRMVNAASSGHPGGSLSAVELLSVLYYKILKHYPDWNKNPNFAKRDRFVLSKGHTAPVLYSILAEFGYFPKEELLTLRKLGSRCQGHPCHLSLPGIEVSTGSLGQGLSLSNGIALSLKLDNNPAKVFVLLGDGELQEGQVWEAFMSSAHYKLNNLIAIIDRNRLQIDGCTESIMAIDPLDKKLQAFNWQTIEIDGHNLNQVYNAYQEAILLGQKTNSPVAIIANTIKGKGVSFMENNAGWHGKAPNAEEMERALEEIKNVNK